MEEKSMLEKILTISATEYVAMRGKELKDYDGKGVHLVFYKNRLNTDKGNEIVKKFTEQLPKNTEVVVDYRTQVGGYSSDTYIVEGTALIPKN